MIVFKNLLFSLLIISNFCTAQEIAKQKENYKENYKDKNFLSILLTSNNSVHNSFLLLSGNKIFNFLKSENKTINDTQLIVTPLNIEKASEALKNNQLGMIQLWLINLKPMNLEEQNKAIESSYDFCYNACMQNANKAHDIVYTSGAWYYAPNTRLTEEEKELFKEYLFKRFERPNLLKNLNPDNDMSKKQKIFDDLYSKVWVIRNIEEEINPDSKNMLRNQFIEHQRNILSKDHNKYASAKGYYENAVKLSNLLTIFHYISIHKKGVLKKIDQNYFNMEFKLCSLAQLFEGKSFIHFEDDPSAGLKYKDLSTKIELLKKS